MTQVDDRSPVPVWPEMAVHSPHMTGRGDRIRRERLRRRMSQMALRDAPGVGLRTIGRIEAGEAENSPSLEVLESYLGLNDDQLPRAGGGQLDEDERVGLDAYTTTELLAEALRRVAHLEATRPADPLSVTARAPRTVRWSSADAPSARRPHAQGEGASESETQ